MALEDEVLSRQMPHDLDAEQAVLGSMLFDAECIKDVMDKLLPEDFYLKQNRDIFTVAYNMFSFSKPIDPLTLAEEMRKSGVYDEQTTRSYLAQLVDFTFSSANVMDYVKILRDKSLLRGLSRAAGEIDTMVQEGLGEASAILEAAEQKVYAIRRGRRAHEGDHCAQGIPVRAGRPLLAGNQLSMIKKRHVFPPYVLMQYRTAMFTGLGTIYIGFGSDWSTLAL